MAQIEISIAGEAVTFLAGRDDTEVSWLAQRIATGFHDEAGLWFTYTTDDGLDQSRWIPASASVVVTWDEALPPGSGPTGGLRLVS
ncbi:MAG: hypothetical protein JWN96_293 [Mycobacterium sp.]|nr:hypothetical protein [Mycobacterium sp.]